MLFLRKRLTRPQGNYENVSLCFCKWRVDESEQSSGDELPMSVAGPASQVEGGFDDWRRVDSLEVSSSGLMKVATMLGVLSASWAIELRCFAGNRPHTDA